MIAAMSAGDQIREERLKKIQLLQEAGMEAFPASTARDTSLRDFSGNFEEFESNGRKVTLAGRVMSLRGQGGIMFATIFVGHTGHIDPH